MNELKTLHERKELLVHVDSRPNSGVVDNELLAFHGLIPDLELGVIQVYQFCRNEVYVVDAA